MCVFLERVLTYCCVQELLALGERIGSVNVGLRENELPKCLTETVYCSSDQAQEEGRCVICLVLFCFKPLTFVQHFDILEIPRTIAEHKCTYFLMSESDI